MRRVRFSRLQHLFSVSDTYLIKFKGPELNIYRISWQNIAEMEYMFSLVYNLLMPDFRTFNLESELSRFCHLFFGILDKKLIFSVIVFPNNFQIQSFWSRYHKIRITECRFAVFGWASICQLEYHFNNRKVKNEL